MAGGNRLSSRSPSSQCIGCSETGPTPMRTVTATLIVIAGLCGCGSSKPLPEVTEETVERQGAPHSQKYAVVPHFERKPVSDADLFGKWTGQKGKLRIELDFLGNGEAEWAIWYPIQTSDGTGSSRGKIGASLNLIDDLDARVVNLLVHTRAKADGTTLAYLEGDGEIIYLTLLPTAQQVNEEYPAVTQLALSRTT